MCRQIVSSLEKWTENPTASLEAYAALRRAYPVLPSGEEKVVENQNSPDKVTVKSERYI